MNTSTIYRKAVAALAVTLALMPAVARSQTLRGDFNMDGRVSIGDVTSMINYLLNGTPGEALPDCQVTYTVNGVDFTMVRVEGGTYMRTLGNPWTVEDFSIGQTEVTIELWNAVMDSVPEINMMTKPQNPVERVSWDDCQEFITRLNAMTGENFRLPTENEWEYAACGGRLTLAYTYAGSNEINPVAWYVSDLPPVEENVPFSYYTRTQPVGTKAPNELGLYDMSGNVAEWVLKFREISTIGDYSPVRGGGAQSYASDCTVLSGFSCEHSKKALYIGFRLAL